MKKKKIDLTLTAALASILMLSACSQENDDWTAQKDTAVCVDKSGQRVPDSNCDGRESANSGSFGGGSNPFLWYYLGRNSAIPAYGEAATGGSFTRTASATYFHAPVSTRVSASEAGISRGGFGSSASSHGFGGGE